MENYVKMLRAPGAEWIQKAWVPKVGDAYYILPTAFTKEYWPKAENKIGHIRTALLCTFLGCEYCYWKAPDAVLWLPRVEDYLGMGNVTVEKLFLFCYNLHSQRYYKNGYIEQFQSSWPELMLAFVQHEIKSSPWDGEGWR